MEEGRGVRGKTLSVPGNSTTQNYCREGSWVIRPIRIPLDLVPESGSVSSLGFGTGASFTQGTIDEVSTPDLPSVPGTLTNRTGTE